MMSSALPFEPEVIENVRIRHFDAIKTNGNLVLPTNNVFAVNREQQPIEAAAIVLRERGYSVKVVPAGYFWELQGWKYAEHDNAEKFAEEVAPNGRH